jgi:hypothetical protein
MHTHINEAVDLPNNSETADITRRLSHPAEGSYLWSMSHTAIQFEMLHVNRRRVNTENDNSRKTRLKYL